MTTDKRAAAIAALKKAREALARVCREQGGKLTMCVPARPDQDDDLVIGDALHKALAALEADDGRALLIELRKWVWRNVDPADGMNKILAEIDRLLAAPEQPAPEPAAPHADDEANAGTSGKGRTDGRVQEVRRQADHLPPVFPGEQVSRRVPDIQVQRGSVADDAASGNECVEERAAPAQPDRGEPERVAHAADEKRIAEWERKAKVNCVHFANERVRYPGYHLRCSQVDAAGALMREFSARAAKAEAEIERLRGRDAEPFDWDAAPSVQEWIDENLPEREPRAGSKMVELHPDEVIADRGESRRVAGWLKDLMAENADLRAKLADAERERDDLREQVGDKGFSLLQQERDEAVEDMLSVAQQVGIVYEAEGHAPKAGPTPAILRAIAAMQRDADDAPRLRSAGVSLKYKLTEATAERDAAVAKLAEAEKRLTTAMCNVAEAEDERNDARSSCFAAKAERDAALAAQNARAVEVLERLWAESVHWTDRDAIRTQLLALRAAKPEPAAEPVPKVVIDGLPSGTLETVGTWDGETLHMRFTPAETVPAAADAKPGDARRSLVQQDHNCWTPELSMAIIDAIDGLDERLRALEVRP